MRSKKQVKNTPRTSSKKILEQMAEIRPLPMGMTEFHEWSDRIISGALLPLKEGDNPEILRRAQKYALSQMIMHLGPTEDHKPDTYFIHQLRKGAVNQVVYEFIQQCDKEKKAKIAAELEAQKMNEADKDGTEKDSD